ncbi:beta-1,4-N-acetylglucosaminyltransferase [Galdieria sulphuraria]|uniref:UDP-N-acetylglucosamine transferase subunit ALG14 n=1 Tax=Galdieria sulphuraria TaxID=130081 RepID=M2WXT2_GALSU|nr:beta-1,4-N-acetylglucosaminyltransferase [Galdieria sulphuraria]EME28850.1 beta-1,4-N-acetylglucosaminyltransferase [Galdieria sulphuraria]|eukprot:XP_005705370.1 beta-1,4-N-acetylglucosaminyltransferase [Galdieria sulphuraria]
MIGLLFLLFGIIFGILLLWSIYEEQCSIKTYRQNLSTNKNWTSWHKRDFERLKSQSCIVEKRKYSLMVVLGSGGHTAEMVQILRTFGQNIFSTRFIGQDDSLSFVEKTCQFLYIVASSDHHSVDKISCLHERDGAMALFPYQILWIPRSRHVGQSYFSSLFTTIYSFVVSSWKLWLCEQPDVLVCNGPGTCVPVVFIMFFRNVFYNLAQRKRRTRIVFIESIARVRSLSLSGRVLYPFVHRFLVQWPDMMDKYPLVEYVGLCL